MKFSSGDVCEIAGIPASSLDRWVLFELVDPENAGNGQGNWRRFNLSQCVALAAAARYRRLGAGFERVAGIVQFLSRLPIERLEAELEAGRVLPVPATMLGLTWLPGMLVEMPADIPESAAGLAQALDLRDVYSTVIKKAERIARRPRRRGPGRRRELLHH